MWANQTYVPVSLNYSGGWQQTSEVHNVYDGKVVLQERDANNWPTVSYTRGRDLSGSLEGAGGIGGCLAAPTTQRSTLGLHRPLRILTTTLTAAATSRP